MPTSLQRPDYAVCSGILEANNDGTNHSLVGRHTTLAPFTQTQAVTI